MSSRTRELAHAIRRDPHGKHTVCGGAALSFHQRDSNACFSLERVVTWSIDELRFTLPHSGASRGARKVLVSPAACQLSRCFCHWVGNDGRLHPVGHQRFAEIFYDGTKVMPEFRGRMVPLIEVVYDTLNRKATQLIRARGYRFPFDPSGRLDVKTQRRLYRWAALLDDRLTGS